MFKGKKIAQNFPIKSCYALLGIGLALFILMIVLRFSLFMNKSTDIINLEDRVLISELPNRKSAELKVAVATMLSPKNTFRDYKWLIDQLGKESNINSVLVIRPNYKDVRIALENDEVDLAFVCTGTYARMFEGKKIELLAQPKLLGKSSYRCSIITNQHISASSLSGLKNSSFAFTDPESNTGCFIPTNELHKLGTNFEEFFSSVIYTGSHDKSIMAVASHFVDAAAVDKLILDRYIEEQPDLLEKLKIIWESPEFGPPPVIIRSNLDPKTKKHLRESIINLHKHEDAKAHLQRIGVESFLEPDPQSYQFIIDLYSESMEKIK